VSEVLTFYSYAVELSGRDDVMNVRIRTRVNDLIN